jgi:citrate synthase
MATGLDGVVVASTVLSEVDGEQGRLVMRGLPVEAVAGAFGFEAAAARLWDGLSGVTETEATVRRSLGVARAEAFDRLAAVVAAGAALPPIDGLRLGLAALPDEAGVAAHHLITGAVPVYLAAIARARHGLPPVAPDPALGHVADFLRMLRGTEAPDEQVKALEAYLVTVMEHGMNASTFTARVIASTQAGVVASVVGAIGALKGPLHGGAPGPVLDMLDAIAAHGDADTWLAGELAAGRRLMGFGHRIYRVRDPRADVLKGVVARLRAAEAGERLAFAEGVEAAARRALAAHKPDRPLDTNVEFYTALLLEAVGLDRALFTPVFAMGRVVGWTAHAFEQVRDGRLMRPQSAYVGPSAN